MLQPTDSMAASSQEVPAVYFQREKCKFLHGISVTDHQCTDLSPKGSIDEGILDLMHNVNSCQGESRYDQQF